MNWADPYFITLTLKQGTMTPHGWVQCTLDIAEQNVRHWTNLLNRELFGYKGRRHPLLRCLPVREGGDGIVRLHYHLIVDKPDTISELDFRIAVVMAWQRTQFGAREVDIQQCYDLTGLLKYNTKYRTKPEYDLSIDWANVHNPE